MDQKGLSSLSNPDVNAKRTWFSTHLTRHTRNWLISMVINKTKGWTVMCVYVMCIWKSLFVVISTHMWLTEHEEHNKNNNAYITHNNKTLREKKCLLLNVFHQFVGVRRSSHS